MISRLEFYAFVILAVVVAFFAGRLFAPHPAAQPVNPNAQTAAIQGLIEAIKLSGKATGPVSVVERPAVSVIREIIPGTSKLSDAEIAAFLSALGKAKTAPVVSVSARLVGPSPVPVAPSDQHLYNVARMADLAAMQEAHIAVQANVTYQEVPESRIGSVFATDGSAGISYAVVRRGRFDADAVGTVYKGNVEAGGGVVWRIPHTQAGVGAGALYRRATVTQTGGVAPVVLLTVQF